MLLCKLRASSCHQIVRISHYPFSLVLLYNCLFTSSHLLPPFLQHAHYKILKSPVIKQTVHHFEVGHGHLVAPGCLCVKVDNHVVAVHHRVHHSDQVQKSLAGKKKTCTFFNYNLWFGFMFVKEHFHCMWVSPKVFQSCPIDNMRNFSAQYTKSMAPTRIRTKHTINVNFVW